jgi:hypothetical protein
MQSKVVPATTPFLLGGPFLLALTVLLGALAAFGLITAGAAFIGVLAALAAHDSLKW